jgi:arsenate reductase-like glutaredoxin family protein
MRGRYHISPDGIARQCDAQTETGCKFGIHFDTKEEAQDYLEKKYKNNYVKESKSVSLAKNSLLNAVVQNEYIDPDLQKIVKDSMTTSKTKRVKTNLDYKDFPAKSIRQSAKTRAETNELRDSFERMKFLASGDTDDRTRLAMYYASKDAVDSDFDLLKSTIKDSNISSDIIYLNHDKTGAFVMESSATVDSKKLQEYLDENSIQDKEFVNTTESISAAKIRDVFNKNNISLDGVLGSSTIYYPNKKTYKDVDGAMKPRYTQEALDERTDAEKRALFCEVGMIKKHLTEDLIQLEKKAAEDYKDGEFFKTNKNPAIKEHAFDKPVLTYTSRTNAVLADEDKARKLMSENHIDPSLVTNVKRNYTIDNLKDNAKKLGFSPYQFMKPQRNMFFRDLEHGDISDIMNKKKTAYTERS